MQSSSSLNGPFVSLCRLAAVVAKEHAETAQKREMSWHWGNTGRLQAEALDHCLSMLAEACTAQGFVSLPEAIQAHETYRDRLSRGSYDADGFMSATVAEVLKVLKRLEKSRLAQIAAALPFAAAFNKGRVLQLFRQEPWASGPRFDI